MTNAPQVINQLLTQVPGGDYSADLLAQLTTLVGQTRTSYCRKVYSASAAAQAVGAVPVQILTSYYWFPYNAPNYDYTAVSPAHVTAGIAYDATLGIGGIRLIDIEHWDPYTESLEAMPNWIRAASMWQAATSYPLGFYRLFPDSISSATYPVSYKNAVAAADKEDEVKWRSIISTWMRRNDANIEQIRPYIDFLCPNVYVFLHGSQVDWQWSAGFSMLEALRIANGLPVRPILWFCARNEVPITALTKAEYVSALQFVAAFPGIDAVLAYSEAPEPGTFTWTDVISDLVHSTGDFV